MQEDAPAAALASESLCRRCDDETARYRRREPHDDRFCFELFRRAIVNRDDACWSGLLRIYGEQVLAWCRRAGGEPAFDVEELAQLVWQKFWHSFTTKNLERARGTAGVLAYLQMCAMSVVIDAARARPNTISLHQKMIERPGDELPLDDQIAAADELAALWAIVRAHLRDEREVVLVSLMFEIGLKPAEAQARRPDLFPDVSDVYRTKRNLMDRLARDSALREWRDQFDL